MTIMISEERPSDTPSPAAPTASEPPAGQREDIALCSSCGGLCCALYLAHDENGDYIGEGWLPEYIDLWLERLVLSGALLVSPTEHHAGAAGVTPLHDPRLSHQPTPEGEAYRAKLPPWVDTRKCQFCHPQTGCLLPRHHRATICGEYVCEQWDVNHRETAQRQGR